MSYYTHYELKINPLTPNVAMPDESKIVKAFSKIEPDIFISCFIDERSEITDFLYGSRIWDNHETSLKEISLKFKNIVFTLHGEGENPADIWNKYFLNGEMFVAKAIIHIPTFEEVYNKSKGE